MSFLGPGFFGSGFTPPGFFGGGLPTPPIFFELELMDWLTEKLGIECLPGLIPQGSKNPMLTWNIVGGGTVSDLSGPAGLGSIQLQLDIWSPEFADTIFLGRRLFDLLAGYQGDVGRATVQGAWRTRQMSDFTPLRNGSSEGIYRSLNEYEFWWSEPKPIR